MKHNVITCDVCGQKKETKSYQISLVFRNSATVDWDVCFDCWGEVNVKKEGARLNFLKKLWRKKP